MIRNLDLTALRSLVTVADLGGITKAANRLNLTQSAVSMQLKRLEEGLGQPLLDRTARTVALTPQGEQLLSYARRLLSLNDEALGRLTAGEFEGEVRFGVPADIVYPHVPAILKRFDRAFPRMRLSLISSNTRELRAMMTEGKADVILTTESTRDPGGITLSAQRLVWIGAPGGSAARQRPLRLAFEQACIFRHWAQQALDDAGIPWEMAVDTGSTRTVEASVSADLTVHVLLENAVTAQFEKIDPSLGLPPLPQTKVNLYRAPTAAGAPIEALIDIICEIYGVRERSRVA
ncbi:MAG: LysR family transcriptional regulator [Pseudomonadota bacterium]